MRYFEMHTVKLFETNQVVVIAYDFGIVGTIESTSQFSSILHCHPNSTWRRYLYRHFFPIMTSNANKDKGITSIYELKFMT